MTEHTIKPTRRQVLASGGTVAGVAALCGNQVNAMPDDVGADLQRYIQFGTKASGGPGDNACGAWLESVLKAQGFSLHRDTFPVPFFEAERAQLVLGDHAVPLIAQAIVVPTGEAGITGPFVRVDPAVPPTKSMAGAIALVDLPFSRWVTALQKPVQSGVRAAIAQGASAVVVITNGPSQQAIALNADGTKPMFDVPVAVLAPDQAAPFLAAAMAGESGTLFLHGHGGRRDAFNFVGRLDRGKPKWIVVSTPRSGWFTCAAERGPGIAIWLALARWAPAALRDYNLAFLCNSAHEYEFLGAQQSIGAIAPAPKDTAMWLTLGACIAARDWHDLIPPMLPLPSADPQRYLVVSPDLFDATNRAFHGQPGLEAPYKTSRFTAGELTTIHNAGYETVAGFFGVHRYFHTQSDDERCIVVEPTRQVIAGCRTLLESVASHA